jgi:hypothetical protein
MERLAYDRQHWPVLIETIVDRIGLDEVKRIIRAIEDRQARERAVDASERVKLEAANSLVGSA